MQLLFLLREIVVRSAADAFHSERRPLLKELTHTQHTRNARDEHVKLQEKLSSSVVMRNNRCISLSGSAPRFKSIVILSPSRPVSSRMSVISFTLPCFTRSMTFSTMASMVVVGGIWVMSMQFADLSYV